MTLAREFRDPDSRPRIGPDPRPQDVLSPEQYSNYKHGRLLAGVNIFFAIILLLGCLATLAKTEPNEDVPPAAFYVMIGFAFAGILGGYFMFRGDRSAARIIYFFAIPILLGIPIGTLIGILTMMNF